MKKHIILVVLALALLFPNSISALDDFYEQNGDAFLLIGDGPVRGIYKLNNLVAGSTPGYLYDGGKAFNLSASMLFNETTNSIKKELWTFSSDGTTGMHFSPYPLVRKCLTSVHVAPDGPYDSGLHDKIVHIHHNYPGNTGSGVGIHDNKSYPSQYTSSYGYLGNCYPCTWKPDPAPGQPGYYLIVNGRWYHSGDDADKINSPFTYLRPDWYGTSSPNTILGPYKMYGFVQCMDGAGYPFRSGWCHKLVRETVQINEEKLKLLSYSVDEKAGPFDRGQAGSVVLGSTNTKDTLCECGDPCAPGTGPGTPIPTGNTPILSCLVSGAGRSYLYTRDYGTPNYALKLNNAAYTGSTIGNPADLTAVKIGVSSKSLTADWVYILGINKINEWLAQANVPSSGFLKELTDVAVSDQWWQTGGIVYAYDKTIPLVYSFVRNETQTKPCIPEVIDISAIPDLPNSIDSDGFGNLYFVSTKRNPENAPGKDMPAFKAAQAYAYEKKSTMVPNLYRAKFKQQVYKGVTMLNYYSGSFMDASGDILLGSNYFEQDFLCEPDQLEDRNKWSMCPGTLVRTSPKVSDTYRTEVAVINVCTPPKVTGTTASIDINGPYDKDMNDSPTPYNDATQYFFTVENAPDFDNNGVNRNGEASDDPNGNNFIGRFPSTTESDQLYFYWKVVQTKNMYGDPLNNVILDGNTRTKETVLPIMFGPGEYEISVRSTFRYYQYDKMPRGVLADRKGDYLSADIAARAKDNSEWAKTKIFVQTYTNPTYPGGACVIMSGKPSDSKGTSYDYRPKLLPGNTSQSSLENSNPANPTGETYVIPQIKSDQPWSFQVRENLANKSAGVDRISAMLQETPPVPGEPHNNLRWLTETPKFSWKISLADPVDSSKSLVNITKETNGATISVAHGDSVFTIPSEPGHYLLKVDASRVYSYEYFEKEFKTLSNGSVITIPVEKTKFVPITIGATCRVCVLDDTPPAQQLADLANTMQKALDISPEYMWGTTGERLSHTADGKSNPTNVVCWVANDNPYGNVGTHANLSPLLVDKYFGLSLKHGITKASGKFLHNNALGMSVPDGLPTALRADGQKRYRNTPDGLTNKDPYKVFQNLYSFNDLPADCPLPKVRSWTYRKYSIAVNDLDYFRQNGANMYPEMSYDYANQLSTYENLVFGFNIVDTSGNAGGDFMLGQIVIKDNDRPLAFIQAKDDKNPDTLMVGPSNILPTYVDGQWVCLAENTGQSEERNGLEDWVFSDINNPGSIFGVDGKFKALAGQPFSAIMAQKSTQEPSTLEIDIPVTFESKLSDNTGNVSITSWELRDKDMALIKDIGAAPKYLNIFRAAGNYVMEMKVQDDARAWPADPANPRNADNEPNKRYLKIIVPISSSRLDIRTIDKTFK
ncbi:MAG: hypothetical protein GX569_07720 [Candidatus Riflebacteria bacterium]|nr:hypothetical protein [Candidatus Riflebacteria bacterium]